MAYDRSDPRSQLAPASSGQAAYAGPFYPAQFGCFYDSAPQITGKGERTWLTRGMNFLVAYTDAEEGAGLTREDQPDEYVLLVPDEDTRVRIEAGGQSKEIGGNTLTIIPPGKSSITTLAGGRLVRMVTTRSEDLAARCGNADAYDDGRQNIPEFKPWPEPPSGYKIRSYDLDIPRQPGRFGRIFRCTTFMVNVLDPQMGPRDTTKLSPHHHDDFEQGSLALDGSFTHHLRWPWTTNLDVWREDEHAHVASPSLTVIPPPSTHTSRGMEAGLNQLIDIFSPPRADFSKQPGWVLNADDYPEPTD
jgi:hypothetical protein